MSKDLTSAFGTLGDAITHIGYCDGVQGVRPCAAVGWRDRGLICCMGKGMPRVGTLAALLRILFLDTQWRFAASFGRSGDRLVHMGYLKDGKLLLAYKAGGVRCEISSAQQTDPHYRL